MVVSVSWLLWIWNSSSSLRNSEMANRDKIIKPECETLKPVTPSRLTDVSPAKHSYIKNSEKWGKTAQGGELQIKVVKFVNSSLQSVSIKLYVHST